MPKKILTRTRRKCSRRPRCWTPRGSAFYDLVTPRWVVRVQFTPWRGFCVRSVYPAGGSQLDRLLVMAPPELSMKRVQKREQGSQGAPTHVAAIESNVLSQFPSLVAHCAVTRYDDGEPRKPGWWTVRTQGAGWVVTVKDPDSGCSLTATGNALDDALTLAELLLSSDDAPWEPDQFLKQQKRR